MGAREKTVETLRELADKIESGEVEIKEMTAPDGQPATFLPTNLPPEILRQIVEQTGGGMVADANNLPPELLEKLRQAQAPENCDCPSCLAHKAGIDYIKGDAVMLGKSGCPLPTVHVRFDCPKDELRNVENAIGKGLSEHYGTHLIWLDDTSMATVHARFGYDAADIAIKKSSKDGNHRTLAAMLAATGCITEEQAGIYGVTATDIITLRTGGAK